MKKLIILTTVISMAMTGTAFAGEWKAGEGANQGKWWYELGTDTYYKDSWVWIDGNRDGVAESYCFDEEGWLLTNTTVKHSVYGAIEVSRTVNADGQWVKDGVVQTMTKEQAKEINRQMEQEVQASSPDDGIITEEELKVQLREQAMEDIKNIARGLEEGTYLYSDGVYSPGIVWDDFNPNALLLDFQAEVEANGGWK